MNDFGPERRKNKRLPSHDSVCFTDPNGWGALCVGSVQERSVGGLSILTESIHPIGTWLDLEIVSEGEHDFGATQFCKGVVCHIDHLPHGGYIMGMRIKVPQPIATVSPSADPIASHTEHLIQRTRKAPSVTIQQPVKVDSTRSEKAYAQQMVAMGMVLLAVLLFIGWGSSQSINPDQVNGAGNSAHLIGDPPEEDSVSSKQSKQRSGSSNAIKLDSYEVAMNTVTIPLPNQKGSTVGDVPQRAIESIGNASGDSVDSVESTFASLDGSADAIANAESVLGNSNPAYSQVYSTLLKAQKAAVNGNRTSALYLSKQALDIADGVAGVWGKVAQEFRHSLVASPGKVPILPDLNNGLTLDDSLDELPLDASVVIYVNKSDFSMKVVKDGNVVWQFPIGLGRNSSTPEGIFTVGNKITLPEWYNKGEPVPSGDAQNPLGKSWIGLSDDGGPTPIGIHPTEQSNSIGEALSGGCIRMRPKDAERLYKVVPLGTPIVIRS